MRATNWVKSIARVKSAARIEGVVVSAGYYAGFLNVSLREARDVDQPLRCELQFTREEAEALRKQLNFYFSECELAERARAHRETEGAALITDVISAEAK